MTGYNIFLSNGSLLTTVNVKSIDQQTNSSLILIGQGIPNYGTQIAQDFVWLLENFSKATPPVHPLIGQIWHDNTKDRLNHYSSAAEWHPLLTAQASFAAKFDMLVAATNIDFTTVQSVAIFTAPDTKKYAPHSLVLVPNGTISATAPPTFNLSASVAGDVLASTSVTIGAADQYARFGVGSLTRMATVTHPTISLNITVAATGGQLHYNAYLFGLTI